MKQIQFRRGTTAEHETFKGAQGELTVDVTKKTVVVHDGSTVGGTPLAKESDIETKISQAVANLVAASPASLDTLKELADALGNDAHFSTTVLTSLGLKAKDSDVLHKTGDETKEGVLTLSNGLKLQGQNVSPFGGFKNYIINGNFDVNQYGKLPLVSDFNQSVIDCFRTANNGSGTLTNALDTITYNGQSYTALKTMATTAVTLPTAGSRYLCCNTALEGFNVYALATKAMTVSFLFECSVAGAYNFNLMKIMQNGAVSKSFVTTFNAIAGVNNVVIHIPADSSIIDKGVNSGMNINIGGATGNLSTTLTNTDGWQVAGENKQYLNTHMNWASTQGAYVKVAQVQLEEGSVATSSKQIPYGLNFSLCQRYLPVILADNSQYAGAVASATTAIINIPFLVGARVAPSGITVTNVAGMFIETANGSLVAVTGCSFRRAGKSAGALSITVAGGLTVGQACSLILGSSAILFTGAEL